VTDETKVCGEIATISNKLSTICTWILCCCCACTVRCSHANEHPSTYPPALGDPDMGGQGNRPPPIDKKYGLADAIQQSQNTQIHVHNRNPTKRWTWHKDIWPADMHHQL